MVIFLGWVKHLMMHFLLEIRGFSSDCHVSLLEGTSMKPWKFGCKNGSQLVRSHSILDGEVPKNLRIPGENAYLENLVYHFSRQLWLVLGVKLMEINSNLFSR